MRSILAAIFLPVMIGATIVLVRHSGNWGVPLAGLGRKHEHVHDEAPQPMRLEIRAPSVSIKLAATLVRGFTGVVIDVDPSITGTMAFQMSERRDKRLIAEAFLDDLRAQGYDVILQGERYLVRPKS